jgi:hypothetical protein
MIRVEVSCGRCSTQLGAATHPHSCVEACRLAMEAAAGKWARESDNSQICNRCVAYVDWLKLPADKRGPEPADPCKRKDR